MKVLVTGGAGYIGSHACKALSQHQITPVTLDNLCYGHEWAVQWGPFYKCDISETERVAEILVKEKIEAVLHFAAFAYVGESVKDPLKYYQNNVVGSLCLFEAMLKAKVKKIVFSSTCATYGNPLQVPIEEACPQEPINPYGKSKLMMEEILRSFVSAYGFSAIALRYFNASGADADLQIGEDHNPETHLIPLALQAAYDSKKPLTVFGTDYPTPDGTCIRDYIHVTDLAEAHVLALKKLSQANYFEAFNLGTGVGASVQQIIDGVSAVTNRKVNVTYGARRPGDPPSLVAGGQKAMNQLGWRPQFSKTDQILKDANRWHQKHFQQGAKL